MTQETNMLASQHGRSGVDLTLISEAEFVVRWRSMVGEPPAAMLNCRADMIRLLVQSVPVARPVIGISSEMLA